MSFLSGFGRVSGPKDVPTDDSILKQTLPSSKNKPSPKKSSSKKGDKKKGNIFG